MAAVHSSRGSGAYDRALAALDTGEPYSIEYRIRGADGEYHWFLGQALPQRDESGGIVRWIDVSRVQQILGNLVSNAIKYTDKGSVTIRLSHVDAGSTPDRLAYVNVDVIDTGPGIAADHQERLFGEFVRVNPGDKPGTGLRLAISQRLATMLGGRITLRSEPGRGSTFSLWLPITGLQYSSESSRQSQ